MSQVIIRLFIGSTDNTWFDFLAEETTLTEVNFWQPSGLAFRAIGPGELFAFRLKSPRNKISGFGVLSSSSVLPLQLAWETFGRSNGVPDYKAMRAVIAKYRPDEAVGPATNIGCRVLVTPVFLPEYLWIDLPRSWSQNIVGGKTFSSSDPEGARVWQQLQDAAQTWSPSSTPGFSEPGSRYGEPMLITPRLGQGAFRVAVTEAYRRQCAVSEGKILPALDAAHIRPFADGGSHLKTNGILLRKDIHSVFDAGYATVDTDHKFVVSDKVREVFDNGNEYRRLHGRQLMLPSNQADWPEVEALRWHNESRYLG